MSTSAVSSNSSVSDVFNNVAYNATTSGTTTKTLGQEDFLKLLSTQLANQDPLKPMEDTAFISQMANFTSLEQTKAMSSTMTQMLAAQQITSANSYLDKQVTITNTNGSTVTGVVNKVVNVDGAAYLDINGTQYKASLVTQVANKPATTAASTSTTDSSSSSTSSNS